jgi:Family of unknown function (DUF6262)
MVWKRNVEGMKDHAKRRAQETRERVDQAITMLVRERKPINFNTVAHSAKVTKSYLYTQPDVRARIEALRTSQRAANTPRSMSNGRTDASKEILLAAKDRRMRELEAENLRLKEDLKKALGRAYGQL